MADAKRDLTPAGKGKSSASLVPSRCVVPSLVTRREVASRYRKPPPNGSKPTSSFARGDRSLSPAARLPPSTCVKVPHTVAGIVDSAVTKINMSNIVPGISKVSEAGTSMDRKGKFCTYGSSVQEKSKYGGKPEATAAHNESCGDDGSVSLDAVSAYLAKLGEEAKTRKSLAMAAAAEALEEAVATDSMMKKLSLFSDLADASKTGDPLPTIVQFFVIYDDISSTLNCQDLPSEQSKSASAWVKAATWTNLDASIVSTHITNPMGSSSSKGKSNFLPTPNSMAMEWAKSNGKKETLKLVMRLLFEMKIWFIRFVKDSFDAGGFKVFGGGESESKAVPPEQGTMAVILRQLKRVNEWMDVIEDHGCEK